MPYERIDIASNMWEKEMYLIHVFVLFIKTTPCKNLIRKKHLFLTIIKHYFT